MSASKTSMIIPVYGATMELWKTTIDCYGSMLDIRERPDEVILVDDASPEPMPNLHWFSPQYARISIDKLVRLPENVGFGQAVNAGLAEASGDILIVSNNDILFNPGWLEALLLPFEKGYDISSIRVTDQGTWATEDKITEGDKFGSLWAMKRKVYETLGGFDERFGRGYFEDLDYRRQALNAGFKIAKNHGGLVEHIGHATFDLVDPKHELYEKNKQVYIDKWGFLE